MDQPVAKKPRVLGLVLVSILRAAAQLFLGIAGVLAVNRNLIQDSGTTLYVYFILATGVVYLISAILIARYKRSGLWISVALVVIDLGVGVIHAVVSNTAPNLAAAGMDFYLVYYAYKYLTQEPEKLFFH